MTLADASHRADCEVLGHWLFGSAVPFWIAHGLDRQGFAHEELRFDGTPNDVGHRRSLVQFRQVYVLARAALAGVGSPSLPCELFRRATAAAWHRDGGFVHALDMNGTVSDSTRDSYDQAFGMLAAAWVYVLDGDSNTLEFAYRTLRFMDDEMASAYGGYLETTSARLPRRQNPHMHLVEAFLVLWEVTGDEIFRARATSIIDLLEHHFVGPTGALREYFDDAWGPADGLAGHIVEPGHHFEWVWLLHEYARLSGEPLSPLASRLFDFAARNGLDARGRPVEQVDTQGVQRRGAVKLWALTEQLKAHVVRAEAAGREFDPTLGAIVRDMREHFLLDEPPVWFEELAADGTPSRRRMPASTLYHVMLAGTELLRWRSGARSPLTQAVL